MQFNKFLTYLFITILLFIGFMTLLIVRTMNNLKQDQDWVTHSKMVQKEVQNIVSATYQMENSVRGELLYPDRYPKSDFNVGISEYKFSIKKLNQLIEDNSKQKMAAKLMARLIDKRIVEIEDFQKLKVDSAHRKQIEINNILNGQEIIRDIRRIGSKMSDEEEHYFIKRKSEFDKSVSQSIGIIILLITIICFILIFAFGIIRNQIKENLISKNEMDKAFAELSRSEEKFRRLNDATSDIICKIDDENTIISWNNAGEKILGYPSHRIVGKNLRSLLQSDEDLKSIRNVVKSDQILDLKVIHQSGKEIPMEVISFDWLLGDENFIGVTFRDNTQRFEQNQIISELGARFDLVLKSAKYGVWDWLDMSGPEQWWSKTLYDLIEYSPDELAASQPNFRSLLHPDDLAAVKRTVYRGEAGPRSFSMEYRLRTKDSGYKWFRAIGEYIDEQDNKRMIGVLYDITEEKEQNLKLIELNQRFDLTMRSAEFGIWDWYDVKNQDIWFSDVFRSLIGYTSAEYPNNMETFRKYLHPEDVDLVFNKVDENIEGQGVYKADFRIFTKNNGFQWFRSVGDSMTDTNSGKKRMIGILYNIEDEVRQKKALEESNKQLEQFAYVASHDLREPLRKIQAFGDRLQMLYKKQHDIPGIEYVERMQNGADRMQNLIEDLLSFSRLSANTGLRTEVDLQLLVQEVLSELDLIIERKKAVFNISPLPWIKDGLKSQLFQLFQNLFSNAIKFTNPEVTPIVTVKGQYHKGHELNELFNDIDVNNEYFLIGITDNGIGFDQENLDKIFTIFQRLHSRSAFEGTGIGLAICKRIVENHNGYITAQSEEGKGATFFMALPTSSILQK